MYAAVHALGGIMKYSEIPGEGHGGWEKIYGDPATLQWLFAQSR
jgi:hypothetical protein